MTEPLTPRQRRAANLLAQGRSQKETAAEVSVSPKTIQRWNDREDFRAEVRRKRESLVGDVEEPEEVLRQALGATLASGLPDWQVRISAARALLATPVASPKGQEAAARIERVYVPLSDEDDGAPRPHPATVREVRGA